MDLNDDVVQGRGRLGPLRQRHPGRSRGLVRHHDRLHPALPVSSVIDAANGNIEDIFCGDSNDSLTGDDWDAGKRLVASASASRQASNSPD
jgi:hypothetical protein